MHRAGRSSVARCGVAVMRCHAHRVFRSACPAVRTGKATAPEMSSWTPFANFIAHNATRHERRHVEVSMSGGARGQTGAERGGGGEPRTVGAGHECAKEDPHSGAEGALPIVGQSQGRGSPRAEASAESRERDRSSRCGQRGRSPSRHVRGWQTSSGSGCRSWRPAGRTSFPRAWGFLGRLPVTLGPAFMIWFLRMQDNAETSGDIHKHSAKCRNMPKLAKTCIKIPKHLYEVLLAGCIGQGQGDRNLSTPAT